jgi:hypothetical protein
VAGQFLSITIVLSLNGRLLVSHLDASGVAVSSGAPHSHLAGCEGLLKICGKMDHGMLCIGGKGARQGYLPCTNRRKSLTGSAPNALAMVMNSMTSSRRSPPSNLATKDWGLPSFFASACWRMPALCRVATRSSIRR